MFAIPVGRFGGKGVTLTVPAAGTSGESFATCVSCGSSGTTLACMEPVARAHLSAKVTAGASAKAGAFGASASLPGPAGVAMGGLAAMDVLTIQPAANVTVIMSRPAAATAPAPNTTLPPTDRNARGIRRILPRNETRPSKERASYNVAVATVIRNSNPIAHI